MDAGVTAAYWYGDLPPPLRTARPMVPSHDFVAPADAARHFDFQVVRLLSRTSKDLPLMRPCLTAWIRSGRKSVDER